MGERDAFGREIGEDTLAEVGWKPAEPTRAQPAPQWEAPKLEPTPAPEPTAFDAGEAWALRQSQPKAPRVPRRRRRGGFARLIFLLAVLVIAAAGASSLIRLGGEAVDRGQQALRDAIPTPPVTQTPGTTLDGGSLLRPAALRKAIAQLPPGRVTVLTIRQDGLDATITADGKTTLVHMEGGGALTSVDAPVEIPGKAIKLDPAAPGRIVRTATRRTGRSAGSISQLVLANGAWTLQFPDGVQFTANAKGTKVRRIT